MRVASSLTLAVLCATSGCSFVTTGELAEIQAGIDSDGDGVADSNDCSPTNPLVSPNGVEIPADGIDNDCDGSDLLDADGDQYPRIDEASYVAIVAGLQGVDEADAIYEWPGNLRVEPDCNDDDAAVNPAASDTPYDGRDDDCGCSDGDLTRRCNDFDQDGDGQSPRIVNGTDITSIATAFFEKHPGLIPDLQDPDLFGDCDDSPGAQDIYAGAPGDVYYDGVDTNCDGSNDFDQDGDGYIRTEDRANYDAFVARFHPSGVPAGWAPAGATEPLDGDCVDAPIVDYPITGIIPGAIYPGAPEAEQPDGIDSDCAGDNDYDVDGDGVAAMEFTEADVDAYRANWSGFNPTTPASIGWPNTIVSLDTALGDCDDSDPTVYPGQTETLFDEIDYDCDNNPNTGPFGFGDYLWDTPQHPRAVVTNDHIVIGTTATWARKPLLGGVQSIRSQPAFTLRFDRLSARSTDDGIDQRWDNIVQTGTPRAHGASFDMIADGDTFWVASSYPLEDTGGNVFTQLLVARHQRNASGYDWLSRFTNTIDLSSVDGIDTDLDLQLHGDFLWAGVSGGAGRIDPDAPASGDGGLRAAVINPATFALLGQVFERLGSESIPGNGGDMCMQRVDDADQIEWTVCDGSGCDVFNGDAAVQPITASPIVDSAATFGTTPYYREMDHKNGLSVFARGGTGGVVVEDEDGLLASWLAGESVLSADAVRADTSGDGIDDKLFVAVVVAGTPNEIWLGWSDLDVVTEPADTAWVVLDPSDDSESFTHCAVGADQDPATCPTETGRNLDPLRVELAASAGRLGIVFTGDSLDTPVSPTSPSGEPYGADPTLPGDQDALGWAFFSYYLDADGDGYPAAAHGVDPSFADSDDSDASIGPILP